MSGSWRVATPKPGKKGERTDQVPVAFCFALQLSLTTGIWLSICLRPDLLLRTPHVVTSEIARSYVTKAPLCNGSQCRYARKDEANIYETRHVIS